MDKDKTPPAPPINGGDTPPQGSPLSGADKLPTSDAFSTDQAAAASNPGSSATAAATGTAPPSGTHSHGAAGAKTASTPPASKLSARKTGGVGKTLVWLVLVIIVVAAGYSLWSRYGEQLRATQGPGDSVGNPSPDMAPSPPANLAVKGQGQDTNTNATIAAALEEEIRARQALQEQLSGQIADLQLQLNSYDDRLRSLSTTSREDWLLAEAEYLLRLASQRILTERQSANALALMESADTILRDFNDTELFAVRRALASDITRVRMVAAVDREGMYLRLGALVDAVDQLDSLLPEPPAPATPKVADVDAVPPPWYQRLLHNARQALVKMAGLVRIERRDVPLEPLLTLEQEQILRHNLKVVLEQARLALLREEQGIYVASLDRAASWVKDNFEADAVSAVFVEEIADLKKQSVVQELPSLTGSIRALQEYIRLWHNRYEGGIEADREEQEPEESPAPTDASAEDSQ